MLDTIIKEFWLELTAVFGFFPANSNGDDIEIYRDESRNEIVTTLHHIRQQMQKAPGQPNYCLADLIAPKSTRKKDYLGGFAVTSGIGIEGHLRMFEENHDDYNSILLKALADRLAEALAEYLHQQVRTEYWGYDSKEELGNDELIQEKYRGIRPAPGYPACPDHTEKQLLFNLLSATSHTGIYLTENFAMFPAASVSGWYFSHPDSKYFTTGKISKDQVEDYANRKGMSLEDTERWLAPILNYD